MTARLKVYAKLKTDSSSDFQNHYSHRSPNIGRSSRQGPIQAASPRWYRQRSPFQRGRSRPGRRKRIGRRSGLEDRQYRIRWKDLCDSMNIFSRCYTMDSNVTAFVYSLVTVLSAHFAMVVVVEVSCPRSPSSSWVVDSLVREADGATSAPASPK